MYEPNCWGIIGVVNGHKGDMVPVVRRVIKLDGQAARVVDAGSIQVGDTIAEPLFHMTKDRTPDTPICQVFPILCIERNEKYNDLICECPKDLKLPIDIETDIVPSKVEWWD